jgi:HPt (histidine-containing phosphotransfer) domain-containing protein
MTPTNLDSDDPILARLQELENETDHEFVLELIDIYISETPKHLTALKAALKEKNLSALTIAAHTLKGSSLNLGAKKLGALCYKLEELGRSGLPILPDTNSQAIEEELEEVTSKLLNFKQNKR